MTFSIERLLRSNLIPYKDRYWFVEVTKLLWYTLSFNVLKKYKQPKNKKVSILIYDIILRTSLVILTLDLKQIYFVNNAYIELFRFVGR